MNQNFCRTLPALLIATALSACGIGQPPKMTSIGEAGPNAGPILTAERAAIAIPAPQPAKYAYQSGSLWNNSPTALLGDKRARSLGDILTVSIEIDEEAEIRNDTQRLREGSEEASVGAFFGISSKLPDDLQSLNPNLELG